MQTGKIAYYISMIEASLALTSTKINRFIIRFPDAYHIENFPQKLPHISGNFKRFDVSRFPTEDKTREKWIEATGKKNWVPHKYTRICSKHFEKNCFRKTEKLTLIKKFCIPTLFIHVS